ncbi:hypothetical protein BH10ACT7_BH10ACT7_17120 [soil metagenome]
MPFRVAALIAAVCATPGILASLGGADIEELLLWLAIGAGGAGIIASFRLWPMTWFTLRGEERVNRAWTQVAIDGLLVVALLVGVTVVLTGLVAAGILYPNAGRTDWSAVPVVALISVILVLFGVIVGAVILIPVASLIAQLGRAAGGKKVDARIVWGGLMLLSVVAFAVLAVLAIDSEGPSRGAIWRSLPTLLFGVETRQATIISEPALWGARVAALVIVACVVGLIRAGGGRRFTGRPPLD